MEALQVIYDGIFKPLWAVGKFLLSLCFHIGEENLSYEGQNLLVFRCPLFLFTAKVGFVVVILKDTEECLLIFLQDC